MTADDKHSHLIRENLTQPIQMQLWQKQKPFSQFFSAFLKSTLNFEHFETNMTLFAYVFRKLETSKDVVTQMSKKFRFRRLYSKQHGKWSQTLLKSNDSTFVTFIDQCEENCVGKSLSYSYVKC